MVFCSLDPLKKPSKKKETRMKKEIVGRDRDGEILGFDLIFVG